MPAFLGKALYTIPWLAYTRWPNADALPLKKQLAVFRGVLRLMSPDALAQQLCHGRKSIWLNPELLHHAAITTNDVSADTWTVLHCHVPIRYETIDLRRERPLNNTTECGKDEQTHRVCPLTMLELFETIPLERLGPGINLLMCETFRTDAWSSCVYVRDHLTKEAANAALDILRHPTTLLRASGSLETLIGSVTRDAIGTYRDLETLAALMARRLMAKVGPKNMARDPGQLTLDKYFH